MASAGPRQRRKSQYYKGSRRDVPRTDVKCKRLNYYRYCNDYPQ